MEHMLKDMYLAAGNAPDYMGAYLGRLENLLKEIDLKVAAEMAHKLEQAREAGRAIYVIGNGGSASVASHFVNDLGPNSLVPDRPGFKVFSLADNVESIMAIANDLDFSAIFEAQLRSYLEPGDIVLALSVSGNSPNILRAVEYAKKSGAFVMGWTGFEGGKLKAMCDLILHVPTTKDEYGPVEDLFTILAHMISGYLSMKGGRFLHH